MLDVTHQRAECEESVDVVPRTSASVPSTGVLPIVGSSLVPQLAVPRRGHVLTRVAELYGDPVREAVAVLCGSLARNPQCADLYETLLPSSDSWKPMPALIRPPAEMVAWAIVSMWISGVASDELPISTTLAEAEAWFFGQAALVRLTALPSVRAISKAEALLREKADPSAYKELLPYILDPHGPGSRLSVKRDPETQTARARKRAEGVFYTPADVAHYMVAACLNSRADNEPVSVFDPACGTGVFLRAALTELRHKHPSWRVSQLAEGFLFGADIDPWPLNAATFVLLTEIRAADETEKVVPAALWRRLRRNFACIDTLRLDQVEADENACCAEISGSPDGRLSLSRVFPALEKGAGVIVGNPPYAKIGVRNDFSELASTFRTLAVKATPTAEIYLPFLEQMIRLSNSDKCASAFVLPLSIGCNIGAQFAAARTLVERTPGHWQFAFFDREPHALFGEDVKTRNTIVLWSKGPTDRQTCIATGPLRKWRGDSRRAMFNSLSFTPIESDIRTGIPKVEGPSQSSALKALSSRWAHLDQAVKGVGRATLHEAPYASEETVFVGPTAYNFLNVFLVPPHGLISPGQSLSEHPLHAIHCASREDALAVFAVLSSHLAYWWWHAHGDGFHVLKRTITSFPFGIETLSGNTAKRLSACGTALWAMICTSPVRSLNCGKISLAFTPNGYDGLRREADEILADVAGLNHAFVNELQQFTAHTVAATLRVRKYNTVNESEGV